MNMKVNEGCSSDQEHNMHLSKTLQHRIPNHNQDCIMIGNASSIQHKRVMASDLTRRSIADFGEAYGHSPLDSDSIASFQRDELLLIPLLHSNANRPSLRLGIDELSKVATDHDDDSTSSFDVLSTDELANVFGFLSPEDLIRARLNKKMNEAAKITIVPMAEFVVDSVSKLRAIATALPLLQQISIRYLREERHEHRDDDEPREGRNARSAGLTSHIDTLSSFKLLKSLDCCRPLSGKCPSYSTFHS